MRAVLLVMLGLVVMIGSAWAQQEVQQRQKVMKEIGEAMKQIDGMFRGERPYDGSALSSAAETVRARAGETMVELFPEGSAGNSSQARPEIWERPEEFAELAGHLERLAAMVAEAGRANPDTFSDDMRMRPGTPTGGGSLLGGRGMVWPAEGETVPAEHALHLMMETCTRVIPVSGSGATERCRKSFHRRTSPHVPGDRIRASTYSDRDASIPGRTELRGA